MDNAKIVSVITRHSNGIITTHLREGRKVCYGMDRRGTIILITSGYNRAGDACFRVKVAWDDGKTSTVNDYQLY